jgi:hypothetical protein
MEVSDQLHDPDALPPGKDPVPIHTLPFLSTGFYSPYLRTLAFLNGLLDPQTFGRTPWLGDQSNATYLTLKTLNIVL